jgi:hypothetical protein
MVKRKLIEITPVSVNANPLVPEWFFPHYELSFKSIPYKAIITDLNVEKKQEYKSLPAHVISMENGGFHLDFRIKDKRKVKMFSRPTEKEKVTLQPGWYRFHGWKLETPDETWYGILNCSCVMLSFEICGVCYGNRMTKNSYYYVPKHHTETYSNPVKCNNCFNYSCKFCITEEDSPTCGKCLTQDSLNDFTNHISDELNQVSARPSTQSNTDDETDEENGKLLDLPMEFLLDPLPIDIETDPVVHDYIQSASSLISASV